MLKSLNVFFLFCCTCVSLSSAFLYFSQDRRSEIKEKNPNILNTEVSRILGEMWRNATQDERQPYIVHEEKEREKYKKEIAAWREEHEAKMEEVKKQQEEQTKLLVEQRQQASQQALYSQSYAPQGGGWPPPPYPQQGMAPYNNYMMYGR